jgi:[ribosomal protein S18]-alanine N-acetyltransferase
MTIRPFLQADVPRVLEIEEATYTRPWTEQIFRDELRQPGRAYLVAEEDGRVVGFGGVLLLGQDAHITTVAVDEAHRGKRIGTRLMLRLVEAALRFDARHLTLEVRFSNRAAQSLYTRFGMSPVGVRKNYYVDEDALIMWVHDIDGPEYEERLADIRAELGEST